MDDNYLQKHAAELFEKNNSDVSSPQEIDLNEFLKEQEIDNERIRERINIARIKKNSDNPYKDMSVDELKTTFNKLPLDESLEEIKYKANENEIIRRELNKIVERTKIESATYNSIYNSIHNNRIQTALIMDQLISMTNKLTKDNNRLCKIIIEQNELIDELTEEK